MTTQPGPGDERLTVFVRGRVQGVGLRWWVRARALELGLTGHAANRDDGRVEVVAQGPRPACEALLSLLDGPPVLRRPGEVSGVTHQWAPAREHDGDFVER